MTRKTTFFKRWSRFKFNNLRLTICIILKFYTNVAKGSKPKVRKFWVLVPTFGEVIGEKLVRGPPTLILNRVNGFTLTQMFYTSTNIRQITVLLAVTLLLQFPNLETGRETLVNGGKSSTLKEKVKVYLIVPCS